MLGEESIIIFGAIGTLAIYSYLWRENALFRIFEHLFIGVSAGLIPIITFRDILFPTVIGPVIGNNVTVLPDGKVLTPYNSLNLLYLLPMIFGLGYYFIYSKKHAWIAKMVIGCTLGFSAGLGIKGFFVEWMPQLVSSAKPLVVFNPEFSIVESLNNILFTLILSSVIFYFFFCFKVDSSKSMKVRKLARYFMMICFGAFFGSTIMARMALLVERIQFLNTAYRTIGP